jgi:hypothetical protein
VTCSVSLAYPHPILYGALVGQEWCAQGRFVVDEPTALPERTEAQHPSLYPGDWLDADDRDALDRALLASQEDIEAGRLFDADEVLEGTADT